MKRDMTVLRGENVNKVKLFKKYFSLIIIVFQLLIIVYLKNIIYTHFWNENQTFRANGARFGYHKIKYYNF